MHSNPVRGRHHHPQQTLGEPSGEGLSLRRLLAYTQATHRTPPRREVPRWFTRLWHNIGSWPTHQGRQRWNILGPQIEGQDLKHFLNMGNQLNLSSLETPGSPVKHFFLGSAYSSSKLPLALLSPDPSW